MEMNETSATSASGLSLLPDGIATLTAIHFTIIAVLAILVVVGLLWGIRAKRSRVKASHDVIANAEEAGVPPEPIAAVEERRAGQSQSQTQTAAPAPVAPTPVAPAPVAAPIAEAPADAPVTPDRLADEPIAAAAPLDASPATEVAPPALPPVETPPVEAAPVAPEPIAPAPIETAPIETITAASYADGPVTQLKGLGPKVAAQLGALGVATVGQMAALSETEAQNIDAQLGNFTGRMGRDRWIEQAWLLAAGDKAGFEAVFGKL